MADADDLLELGRLAVVGRLTRGVVHELNNPLFVVLTLAELLSRDAVPGSPAAGRLAQLQESGAELRSLLGALGEVARAPRELSPEAVAVAPLLGEAVELIRRATLRKDVEIVERCDDGGAVVTAVPSLLRLALLGLLAEAQEATPEGGTVEVATQRRGDRVAVVVRWACLPGADGPAAGDRLLEPVVAGCGGTLLTTAAVAGGREAVLSLPVR